MQANQNLINHYPTYFGYRLRSVNFKQWYFVIQLWNFRETSLDQLNYTFENFDKVAWLLDKNSDFKKFGLKRNNWIGNPNSKYDFYFGC